MGQENLSPALADKIFALRICTNFLLCLTVLPVSIIHMLILLSGSRRVGQGLLQVRVGARQAKGRARAWYHDRHCPLEIRDSQILRYSHWYDLLFLN